MSDNWRERREEAWNEELTGRNWSRASWRAQAEEQAPWMPMWRGETGRKITSTDYRGKAGVDTTLGNSFSMNCQTTAFLKTGIQPTLINGCIQEISCYASKERAHPIRYHQGPPSGSNVQEAHQISPLAQIAVKLHCDSAHRHARRHLFLLNSWHSQWESKMKEHRLDTRKLQEIRTVLSPNHLDEAMDLSEWGVRPSKLVPFPS